MSRQRGITLIELLVALTLSLILVTGVIELFIANKKTYQLADALGKLQDNARFAAHKLAYDIRMAGYTGCTSRDHNNIHVNNTLAGGYSFDFDPGQGLQGWEAANTAYGAYNSGVGENYASVVSIATSNWTSVDSNGNVISATASNSGLPAGTDAVATSDMIKVWGITSPSSTGKDVMVTNISPGTGQTVLTLTDVSGIQVGDILMLTNCSVADVVQASNVNSSTLHVVTSASGTPGNDVTKALLNTAGAQLFNLQSWLYYIGKRNNLASNPPALFLRVTGQNATAKAPEEIVEGVESMQILYGDDTDGDAVANRYVPADKVDSWLNVVSVRIALLMQSERTDLVDGSQSVTFNGTTVTSHDGRLRYPFVFTVTLRNRIQ